ncbi:hypothetical protein ACFL00_03585 [Pseudomonadota bacterium]
MKARVFTVLCSGFLLLHTNPGMAGGVPIDKIYHPYVQPNEQELEWRGVFQDTEVGVADNFQVQRLAYGRSVSDRWFMEFYLTSEASDAESFKLNSYELEAKWQLTEQGEFWADWGLLFELEKKSDIDAWDYSTGILVEKEWGKWSGTANFIAKREWGSAVKNDWKTRIGLQARYRYSRTFEPALEFYSGQNTLDLGPAFMGQFRLGTKYQLRWEAGVIFGLDESSPNRTFRFSLEFEF